MDIVVDSWTDEEEGVLSKWFVVDGAVVNQGDLLATVALEKIEFEVEAPASGTIKIHVGAEETIRAGDAIASIV